MSLRRSLTLGIFGWVAGISLLHAWLNLGVFDKPTRRAGRGASSASASCPSPAT